MVLPAYARATVSSALKANPVPAKDEHQETAQGTPKKLKRPSTLTVEDRQHIAYNADLYPIKPLDPTKPCRLAELPSEVRTTIYSYALDEHSPLLYPWWDRWAKPEPAMRIICPTLLHVCRAIRIEAAYTYYTSTPFTIRVRNLNFSVVQRLFKQLPRSHRILLSKNQHLTINVIPYVRSTYRYPPADFEIDALIKDHWKACQPFGNLYTITDTPNRQNFILFCRLASWWLWCAQPPFENTQWKYTFHTDVAGINSTILQLTRFLKSHLVCIVRPSVERAWKTRKDAGKMTKEAVSFFEQLEDALRISFVDYGYYGDDEAKMKECKNILRCVKKIATKWENEEGHETIR